MEELQRKLKDLQNARQKYRQEHSVHIFKAKYVGCEGCGSKLNKEHLVGEKCPLCRTDLRSKTTIEKLEWYDTKERQIISKIESEKEKQSKKAKVKWLIKIEYHS